MSPKPASVQTMVDRTLAELGRIDILVNNAGLALVSGKHDLWDVEEDDWDREIDVNLNGVFHCCKAVARALVDQKRRRPHHQHLIARRSRRRSRSTAATLPPSSRVVGLTQGLALELAPHGVTVNCIAPGSTDTDMMDGTFRRTGERMNVPFEMVRPASPASSPSAARQTPPRSPPSSPTSPHPPPPTSPARPSTSTAA